MDERLKYLIVMEPRYLKARRKEKGLLLEEMAKVMGYNQKYLAQLLGRGLRRQPCAGRRGRTYGADVDDACG